GGAVERLDSAFEDRESCHKVILRLLGMSRISWRTCRGFVGGSQHQCSRTAPALRETGSRGGPAPHAARPAESLPGAPPAAIEAAREVHLHFQGAAAEDVAAIVARVNREGR